ncbi:hypothetical protein O6H91_12G059300 [Diphasiastrum complanatum]|nr:hypothetical protein O6H91_12G059300 [Diphasiastrum complanatum]KAJ7536190.1 hypothetical protein O6H91_12G059300 [Diphasiastrum complanatum]
MQIVATSLQSDLLVAATLQSPQRLAETVLCVPAGQVTVPVRLSQAVLAAVTCKVVSTEGLLLPSVLTAALGARPKRFLATQFWTEGCKGLCYALWLEPDRVPDTAESVMVEAGDSLPLLLANRVRALCCDRMGRRFDAILKRMPQAVVFVDAGFGPCLINPAAAKLLGLSSAGETDPIEVAFGMRKLADRSICRSKAYRDLMSLAGNPSQKIEWDLELKDPRCVLRVRSYPISNIATHGRVWFFDDITSERDAHDAVEAADAAKSQFLAMMSHELRTPLTGVLGMLDLLRLTRLTPEQTGYVRVMQGSAEGLIQVLDEIIDFSKIQSGHLALEVVDFHIGELLEQVSALFQGRLAERKLTLTVQVPRKDEMCVRGDPNRIRQVLTNLVSNAIKFTEQGGIGISWKRIMKSTYAYSDCKDMSATGIDADARTIGHQITGESDPKNNIEIGHSDVLLSEVDDFDKGGEYKLPTFGETCEIDSTLPTNADASVEPRWMFEVRVADTGIGLSKEQQKKLFQSFSQADSSTTRKFGGTGLGLAICKGLVEVMGGKIWVESEPCKGSVFAFSVPLLPALDPLTFLATRQSVENHKVLPQQFLHESKSLKFLVAEDNMVNQLLIKKMLKHYGHEVELVGNGQLAVDAVRKRKYDIILMDLQMPVLDGLKATKAIRALGGTASVLPIYALTADVLTKGKDTLEAMGLDGYLTKPINWEKLSQVIDEVVTSGNSGGCDFNGC